MAYQVLARKWRPHDFSTLIGQDHVVKALTHALTHNRLHHAYLFTGTRGVGKTTISRILAKCLNCTGPDGKGGITATPCGVCDACTSIDQDRFVDYIEMDAASTRGLDDMVTLLERAKYPPTNARFKVYMIDEVHQLTSQAFNAMLKTLEEPPEYVKFILATTDPQKVPVTVLSRCLQFSLKNLSPTAVADHMKELLEKEKIWYEPEAVRMLAEGAKGSMRDGLSLLDQAIAYSAEHLSVDNVREMLGTVDTTTLYRLLSALAARDAASVIAVADEIGSRGLSYDQALKDLAIILQRVSMAQFFPQSLLPAQPDAQAIKSLADAFQPDEVQLYYQTAIHSRNELNLAPDEYSGFTMALLRMLAFSPYDGSVPRKAVVKPVQAPSIANASSTSLEAKAETKTDSAPTATAANESKKEQTPEVAPTADLSASDSHEQKEEVETKASSEVTAPAKKSVRKASKSRTGSTKDDEKKSAEASTNKLSNTEEEKSNTKEAPSQEKQTEANSVEQSSQASALKKDVKKKPEPSVEVSALSEQQVPRAADKEKDSSEFAGEIQNSVAEEDAREVEALDARPIEEPPEDFDVPVEEYLSEAGYPQSSSGSFLDSPPTEPESIAQPQVDDFKGIPVKTNPWLEVAKKIKLPAESQPLVTESEFVSYENGEMVISNWMQTLCGPQHTEALAEELKKLLGPNCALKVIHSPKKGSQTLSRLLKQEFQEEKKKKLDKISSTKRVKEIADFFGAPLTVENLTLFDKNNNPREI